MGIIKLLLSFMIKGSHKKRPENGVGSHWGILVALEQLEPDTTGL